MESTAGPHESRQRKTKRVVNQKEREALAEVKRSNSVDKINLDEAIQRELSFFIRLPVRKINSLGRTISY